MNKGYGDGRYRPCYVELLSRMRTVTESVFPLKANVKRSCDLTLEKVEWLAASWVEVLRTVPPATALVARVESPLARQTALKVRPAVTLSSESKLSCSS